MPQVKKNDVPQWITPTIKYLIRFQLSIEQFINRPGFQEIITYFLPFFAWVAQTQVYSFCN